MKNGRGKLEYASGAIFEGEFRNDKVTGKGVIQYPNKDRYEGDPALQVTLQRLAL